MWPVVPCTNDAACQALCARAVWVFAGRASASVRDRLTTRPHWYGLFGPDEPIAVIVFFLGAMAMKNC